MARHGQPETWAGRLVRLAAALIAALALGGTAPLAADPVAPDAGKPAITDPETAKLRFAEALKAYDAGRYSQAYALWLPLAQAGDPAAQRNLGHIYRFGLGMPQDFENAVLWYRHAAEAGLARAQANLGTMYLRGQGVEQDSGAASYWITGAALQGHAIAQFNLALLYLRGEGVPRSEAIALGWLFRAAQSGHKGALEAMGRLVPRISGPFGPPPPPLELPPMHAPDMATADAATDRAGSADTAPDSERGWSPADPAPETATAELAASDGAPEQEPSMWAKIGRTLVEQTENWLKSDQDAGFERNAQGFAAN